MSDERLAVIVVHGMGQQLPYETIESVVENIHDGPPSARIAKREKLGKDSLSFVETRVGGKTVDVFEAYWAPTTEGRVTLRDVMGFLAGAAWNGIKNAKRGTAWREERGGGRKPVTVLLLGYVALVLGALVAMNLVIATLTARSLAGLRAASPALLTDLTYVFGAFLVVLALFVGSLKFAERKRAMAPLANVMMHVTLASTIVAATGLGLLFAFRGSATAPLVGSLILHPALIGGTWIALAVASYWIRGLLVQYLGDVAAYVSSHKLDRFTAIREEIRDSVVRVMTNVYAAKDGKKQRYAGVSIVGHSLGSVVAYEALNGLILKDEDAEEHLDVAHRTRLLLTFGSPLDKTTYLFAQSAGTSSAVRETLLELKQPLLSKPESRPRAWINVWSKADPASGELDFFHGPQEGQRVRNEPDPDATTPLLAHNEYWANKTIWRFLREEIVKEAPVKREIRISREVPVRVRGLEAKAEKIAR